MALTSLAQSVRVPLKLWPRTAWPSEVEQEQRCIRLRDFCNSASILEKDVSCIMRVLHIGRKGHGEEILVFGFWAHVPSHSAARVYWLSPAEL